MPSSTAADCKTGSTLLSVANLEMRLSIPAFSFDKTGTKVRSSVLSGPEMSSMRTGSENKSVSRLIYVEPTTRDVFVLSGNAPIHCQSQHLLH